YYSSIRPKQVTGRCERPVTALRQRGIQYVEVRCMDIDPDAPAGIDIRTSRFMDTFLLYCAIEDSPFFPPPGFCQDSQDNFALVAREGRRPDLTLARDGAEVRLRDWGLQILDRMQPYAGLLDEALGSDGHARALDAQRAKLLDPDVTPSGRLLAQLRDSRIEFHDWTLRQSQAHWAVLQAHRLAPEKLAAYDEAARRSLVEQAALEAGDTESFEQYVARFHAALDVPVDRDGRHPGPVRSGMATQGSKHL